MDKGRKTTLLSLRLKTRITTQDIAQEAGVKLAEAYVVEIGGFVERAIVEKVIAAFSRLSGTTLHLDDILFQNVPPLQLSTRKTDEYVQ